MYHHVKPILKRCPTYILLHCGTNNATYQNAQIFLDSILNLKHFIETNLPSCTVVISTPVMSVDNKKANSIIKDLNGLLQKLDIPKINTENLDIQHLGKKGLHSNRRGPGRLVLNIIQYIRCL